MRPEPDERREGRRTGGERSGRRAFTLLEIMMVVIMIAILVSMALPQYTKVTRKARRAEAVDALMQLRAAVLRYQAENSAWPASGADITAVFDAVFSASTASWSYSIPNANGDVQATGKAGVLSAQCVMIVRPDGTITDTNGISPAGVPQGTCP